MPRSRDAHFLISKCSPRHLRGMISSTFQLACTLGIFLSNVVNYNSRWYHGVRLSLHGEPSREVSNAVRLQSSQWRVPVSLSMAFAVICEHQPRLCSWGARR